MDRTERFYKIQDLLKQYKKLTMKQLQDSLGVSRATACRDLDYLRAESSIPYIFALDVGPLQVMRLREKYDSSSSAAGARRLRMRYS